MNWVNTPPGPGWYAIRKHKAKDPNPRLARVENINGVLMANVDGIHEYDEEAFLNDTGVSKLKLRPLETVEQKLQWYRIGMLFGDL